MIKASGEPQMRRDILCKISKCFNKFFIIPTVEFVIFNRNLIFIADLPVSLSKKPNEDEQRYDIHDAVGLMKRKIYSKSRPNETTTITIDMADPNFGVFGDCDLLTDGVVPDTDRSSWH